MDGRIDGWRNWDTETLVPRFGNVKDWKRVSSDHTNEKQRSLWNKTKF